MKATEMLEKKKTTILLIKLSFHVSRREKHGVQRKLNQIKLNIFNTFQH